MLLYSEHTHVCFMKWQRHDCLLHRRPQICVALGQQVVLCVQKAERIGALTWRLVLLAPPQVTRCNSMLPCPPDRLHCSWFVGSFRHLSLFDSSWSALLQLPLAQVCLCHHRINGVAVVL